MSETDGKIVVGRESVADKAGKARKEDPSLDNERLRLTVDFPPASTKRLKDLKDLLEAPSYIDVLRASLKILEAAVLAKKAGGQVVIIEKDGSKRDYEGLIAA